MRRTRLVALATASLMSAAGTLSLTATQAGAQPAQDPQTSSAHAKGNPSDSLSTKWQRKYQKRNEAALEKRVRGGSGESVRLGRHKYGRVAQTGTDKIFVVLAQFGDTQHSAYAGPGPIRTSTPRVVNSPITTRSPRPTGRPTTPRSGRRTTTRATTTTCTSTA